jgi:ADP-heptose:LPS heptosyltransferase
MKVLVVRFSSIGDVVLTTPVVRCLKEQVPSIEIHFITKKSFSTVLEGNPYISKVITIESSVKEVIDELKNENYDYVVDLHNNIRTLKLKRALGVKSAAFPKKNIPKFLLTKFKINRLPKIHVVDRYFEATSFFSIKPDGKPCDFFLSIEDEVDLASYQLTPKKYIAVAMGAQFGTKQIPIELLLNVLKEQSAPIVLLGGKMDIERSQALKDSLNTQNVIDFCGKLSLRASAFMTSQAQCLLSGDTGLMHIASAFETPIVSVWGNTVPDFGMYPYAPLHQEIYSIHEVKDLSCRPCSKIGYQSCPKKHFHCMNQQDTVAIKNDLLQKTSC